MTGEERRKSLLKLIVESGVPISATKCAGIYNVSRQVIVQDIALLRALGNNITSTNRGYVLDVKSVCVRILKVRHSDKEIREELYGIVDLGGKVIDVFVNHKIYGKIQAILNIDSRRKVDTFIDDIESGRSTPLKNITSDFHYHTIEAEDGKTLNLIEENLAKQGFLIKKDA